VNDNPEAKARAAQLTISTSLTERFMASGIDAARYGLPDVRQHFCRSELCFLPTTDITTASGVSRNAA
jgi:hypothetical protein